MRGNRNAKLILFIFFNLFLFTFTLEGAEYIDISAIQSEINRNNTAWVAAENEMSTLSIDQLKGQCGTKTDSLKSSYDALLERTSGEKLDKDLPRVFDWRNYHGVNFISKIKKQNCGDDWAFAAIAALESSAIIENGQNIDLSEQILVSDVFDDGDCKSGEIGSILKSLTTIGSPIEQCSPYRGGEKEQGGFLCSNWLNKTYRFKKFELVAQDVDRIKDAIYFNGPVLAVMNVYSDFAAYNEGIYKHVMGEFLGSRSVIVVGYNDIDQSFTVKNSWGSSWGEDGFFRISYGALQSKVKFASHVFRFNQRIDHSILQDTNPLFPENIQNSSSIKGISLSEDQWIYYKINLPATSSLLKVKLTNGMGDADLYVKYGMLPTKSVYDRRPFKNGNKENILIRYPFPGYYYIGIHAQQSATDAVLFAEYLDTDISPEPKGTGEIQLGQVLRNITGATGQWLYYKIFIPKGTPQLVVKMSGGKGDADLYVKFNSEPTFDSFDNRPYKWGNNEVHKIANPSEGHYFIGLRGYHSFSNVQLEALAMLP